MYQNLKTNRTMKKIAALLLCCAFGIAAMAQSVTDPKYGKGAVKEVNGIVTFQKSLDVQGNSDAYESVLTWAKGRFNPPTVKTAKIARESKDDKAFTFISNEMLVFKLTDFFSDESEISYTFRVSVEGNSVKVTMSDIAYRYDGRSFKAEDWISDKESINKKGTKFISTTKKFRIKTIDLYEDLCSQISQVLDGTYMD